MVRLTQKDFLLRFFLVFVPLYILFTTIEISGLETAVASAVSGLLSLSSAPSVSENNLIVAGRLSVRIVPSCTGLVSLAILTAMVFSVGVVEKRRQILLVLLGFAVLFVWNIVRVYVTVLFGLKSPFLFELLHATTWMLSGGFIIYLWYFELVRKLGIKLA